jgi:hypothetical protein
MWFRYEDNEGNWHTGCADSMDALERFVIVQTGHAPECIQEDDDTRLEVVVQAMASAPHYPLMDLSDMMEQVLSQVSMAASRHEGQNVPIILPITREIEADDGNAMLVIRPVLN